MYDEKNNYRTVTLPIGYKDAKCPCCHNQKLVGKVITKYADENDPDIVCQSCGKVINEVMSIVKL